MGRWLYWRSSFDLSTYTNSFWIAVRRTKSEYLQDTLRPPNNADADAWEPDHVGRSIHWKTVPRLVLAELRSLRHCDDARAFFANTRIEG